ncbi:MAG: hypothetical protein ABH842_05775 [Candidatus Micrarchaeota archaeon]
MPFNRYLLFALLLLGIFIYIFEQNTVVQTSDADLVIHFFYSPSCSHCAEQEPFNQQFEAEFEEIDIIYHNVEVPSETRLLLIMAQNVSFDVSDLGTPTTFIGNNIFVGFEQNSTPLELRSTILRCLDGDCGANSSSKSKTEITQSVDLPILGKADLSSFSLPVLAVVLGLVDGFNPCAMWVLVYLIGLIMNLKDKKKLILIVGTFVFTSGILYFFFMTAWLNAFLFLGYVRPVNILVGLVALGAGIISLKEYHDTGGAMVCKASDGKAKKKIAHQAKEIISAPLTWLTFIGIIALAFTVNSIEFVCSAALPAVFTQVLALSDLSQLEYYAYILLYVFAFMLDDLVVFGSAIFIYSHLTDDYAKYCKIIGGVIMLLLGLILLFAPNFLN